MLSHSQGKTRIRKTRESRYQQDDPIDRPATDHAGGSVGQHPSQLVPDGLSEEHQAELGEEVSSLSLLLLG